MIHFVQKNYRWLLVKKLLTVYSQNCGTTRRWVPLRCAFPNTCWERFLNRLGWVELVLLKRKIGFCGFWVGLLIDPSVPQFFEKTGYLPALEQQKFSVLFAAAYCTHLWFWLDVTYQLRHCKVGLSLSWFSCWAAGKIVVPSVTSKSKIGQFCFDRFQKTLRHYKSI